MRRSAGDQFAEQQFLAGFIATSAEYTPPVIYSLDERNKLVYLIQARPSRPDVLRVGQPISVFLNPRTPVADKR